ncbi:YbaB/EbfC family nucleoid-associated protein [Propionibacteriaceae bacterium Y1685]|uniref:YbaB/EbfC family nucleoid-associated protein n=1 Tax=Microlunatus sp. Y1700 TaxID=3418487 RepID=UPI003B786429
MTQWPENEDDEFEFYDPTAPAVSGDSPDVEYEGDPDIPPGGHADETGSVHVWFDDDKHLSEVRISNRWRERLKGQSLQEAVQKVLTAMVMVGSRPEWVPKVTLHPPSPLSDAALDRLMERTITADEKARELASRDDVQSTRLIGEEAVGHSQNRQVTVTFSVEGRPKAVTLDEEWVSQARAAGIGESILEAYNDARASWVPPTVEAGEWDLLAAERRDIRDEILALFKHGF